MSTVSRSGVDPSSFVDEFLCDKNNMQLGTCQIYYYVNNNIKLFKQLEKYVFEIISAYIFYLHENMHIVEWTKNA